MRAVDDSSLAYALTDRTLRILALAKSSANAGPITLFDLLVALTREGGCATAILREAGVPSKQAADDAAYSDLVRTGRQVLAGMTKEEQAPIARAAMDYRRSLDRVARSSVRPDDPGILLIGPERLLASIVERHPTECRRALVERLGWPGRLPALRRVVRARAAALEPVVIRLDDARLIEVGGWLCGE